jgi:hypothetical protein
VPLSADEERDGGRNTEQRWVLSRRDVRPVDADAATASLARQAHRDGLGYALAIRAAVPLDVLRDTIQPSPSFSEIYNGTLKALRREVAVAKG